MTTAEVLVLGASGQIGIRVIPRLVAKGFRVVAASRNPRPAWFPELKGVRWLSSLEIRPVELAGIRYLVSAGPIRLATQLARNCDSLERAVVFSTSSVFTKLESHDRREKLQMQQILMEEAGLSAVCEAAGASLCLFRPTLIYGCGMDGNVTWLARWIERFGIVPVAGTAAGLRQPVHADDLAIAARTALMQASPVSLDVPLCGGTTLSFRQMVERIFVALDKPARIIPVPRGLFMGMVRLARLWPGMRSVRAEMVRREGVDLVFDDQVARRVLDYRPREFEPTRDTFRRPTATELSTLASQG